MNYFNISNSSPTSEDPDFVILRSAISALIAFCKLIKFDFDILFDFFFVLNIFKKFDFFVTYSYVLGKN